MHTKGADLSLTRKVWNILTAFLFTFNIVFGTVPAVSAQPAAQEVLPSVTTDKADYQPGELVTVTGANWVNDTQVHLVVNDAIGQTWAHDVTLDVVDGGFTDSFNLPDTFIANYMVTATGVQSGQTAAATFTDAPALTLTKSASPLTFTATGQVINFSYLLTNTGSTTLNGPFTVTDNKVPSVSCPATATLASSASITCTGTYTISAADLALGYAVNTATASSSNPGATTSNTDARIVSLPVECRTDSDGANDVPGQKDLTQECDAPTAANPLVISWNWDVISMSGGNSADACALFDTDNDGLANYAICASWQNNRVMQAGYPVLYTCTDTRSDRCTGSTPLTITHGSACALELSPDDPFSTGDSYPNDTKAFCSINLADVGGASISNLIDVCSYPSAVPNSDPSDCVVISAAKANMEVIKSVVPNDTSTNWNVSWTGPTPYSTTITGSGETGIQTVNLGTYTATEAAGTGADLSLYDSTWACTLNGAPSISGSGTTTTGLSLAKGNVGICTFTNTRKSGSLEIKKDVVPDNSSTNWNFAVTGPDPNFTSCSIAGDGTCGAKTVFTGSYSITETAGSGTNLSDYGTSYACTVNGSAGPSGSGTTISGLTINKSDTVVCTFTNSQSPGTLTVTKKVVPSTDTGKFNLLIDGTAKANDVGDGGTTGAVSVSAGSHTVSESAGTGTDLNNYVTTITGDCDASGNVSVQPNQTKSCTITNTRKGTIIVEKQTDPDGAAGSFTFTGDAAGTISDNGQIVVSNLAPGTYASTESSLAADFALESISCDDGSSATPSTVDLASKTATFKLDPGETVKCTFTNKKLNPDLAVTKTADAAAVTAGDLVGFSISVKNNGLGTANNVTLSDTLPSVPGVTWSIASQPSGDPCTLTGASLSCTFGNLAPGATAGPVHITGTSVASSCGTWNNTATAQADNNSAVTGSASIFVDCATIKIAKTAASGTVSAGDSISFTITVTNDNSGTAHNVSVSDTLPINAGLGTWTLSGTDSGACSISAGVLTCNFGDVVGHASKTVTLTASTTAATCGTVSNTASVTTSNDGSDSSTATITVQCPSLSVTKTPDAATVNAGDPVGFTITVHNAGPGVAKSVTLTDTLPAGLTWTVPSGCTLTGQNLSCSLGDLVGGADASVHVTATSTTSTCGPLTNTATATPTNGEAATSDPATVTVNCADVTVSKTGNGPVSAADTATFTITVTVTGSGSLNNVTLSDPLPAGVTWAIDPSITACSISGSPQVLSCSWATLAAPQTITIAISGTTSQANCAAPLSNTATVAAANETDTTNDTSSASITVECATIQIEKTTSSPIVSAGDPISYTITVSNPGTGIARNVTVTDSLPANAGLNWSYPASCSVSGGVLTCNLGDIAGGGSKSVTLTSPTTAATCGTVSNVASVITSNDGSATTPESDITVNCPALEVTKTPDAASVSAGDMIGYTITVSNAGQGEAKGVMITDSLPGGLAWTVDAGNTTASGCSITSGALTCGPDTIASGGSVKVHVTAVSIPAVCGTLTNTASATPTNGAAITSQESTITILCPDLTVSKTGNGPISAGDTATFTIEVKNTGAGEAKNVTLTDTLPGGLTWALDPTNPACSISGTTTQTLSCSWASLASNASVSVTVSAVTSKDNCGTLTNSASAAANNEQNTSNNSSGDAVIEIDCATIQIEKTTTSPTVSAGDPISYTIKVTNPGLGRADNVVVTDSLPGGLAWTINPAVTGCSISGSTLTCTFGSIASGGSKSVTVTARTTAANCGTLTNTASVATSNDGAATSPETTITVLCPNLSVTKTPDAAAVSAGDTIGFTITVSNAGPGTAYGVTTTDSLPGGLAWTVDAGNTTSAGCSISSSTLTCGPDTIASGGSVKVHVTAVSTPAVCMSLNNQATATPTNGEAATSGTAAVMVLCPDLTVTKTGNGPISAGDMAQFTITVKNTGAGEAKNVSLTDTLPQGVTWALTPPVTGCEITGTTTQTLSCSWATLASGADILIVVSGATSAANCGGALNNGVTITASNEAATDNNSGNASITVNCATIQIEKTTTTPVVSAGTPINFTITVTNPGAGIARNVVVNDSLPTTPGLTWTIDPAVSGCSITGGTLTCNFGDLASGGSKFVTLTSPTTAAACGSVSNTASVTTTNDGSGQSSASITVNCPDLTVEKTGNGTINSNDTAIFTITVTNSGAGDATGITLSDQLPAGIVWSVDYGSCSIDQNNLLTCSFGTLSAGNKITIHVSGTVPPTVCGPLSNTVNAAATNEADISNNSATGTVTVDCASISITKTAASPISAGDTLSYTITVSNTGAGTAYGVTVTDTLPTTDGLGPWTVTPGTPICAITGGVLNCSLGDMAAGATQTITLSSPTTYASCGTIFNEASVNSTNDGSGKAGTNVVVQCPALEVTKTADADVVSAGDTIGFTITVTNTGDGIARNVSLSDTLPTATGIIWSIASSDPTCSITGGVLSCTFGDLAKGETRAVHVTSPTTKDSCTDYYNTATATADNQPSVSSPRAVITVQCATIQIEKTAILDAVNAGDTIGFTIIVTNPGPGTAYGVTVTDTLPTNPGLDWEVTGQPSGNPLPCSISGGVLTCNIGTLARYMSASIRIESPTTAATCGTVENTAHVSTTNDGSGEAGDSLTVNCPDLTITKTPDAGTVSAGDTIGFTITVTNSGLGMAYGVSLSDTLPTNSGLAWSISPTVSGCSITSGVLTCNVGTLNPSATFSVHVSSPTTPASCGGTVDNTASVTATNEAATGNNSAGGSITVNCPSLSVTKTADAASVNAGDVIGFTISVSNGGPGVAKSVTLTDTLPSGSGISWSLAGGTGAAYCQPITGGVLTCNFGDMAAGASYDVHVTSPTDATSCGVYNNTATIVSANQADVTGTDSTTVNCASISITKTTTTPTVSEGEPVSYTLTVTNSGEGTAHGVTVTDILPNNAGLDWTVNPVVTGCSVTAGVLTCNLGDLAAHASQTITLTSLTTYASCATLSNTASVTTSNDGSGNSQPATITINCPALTVTKTADAETVSAGDPIGFVITVANTGDGVAKNVTLSDTLQIGLGINWSIASSDPTCTYNEPNLTCSFGDLAKGESKRVHITSPTTAGSCTTYNNTVTASAGNQPSVTAGPVSTTVLCAGITITKVADDETVSAGDTIGFTIEVTNPGPGTAYGVTITDTLPTNPGLDWSISPAVQGCSITSGVLTCNVGTLLANKGFLVHISSPTTAATCGIVENAASVTTTNDGSASASDGVIINCPDITVTKTASSTPVNAGDPIGFTITVKNTGAGEAFNVQLTDTLPTGTGINWTIDTATGDGGVCSIDTNTSTVTCPFGNLDPGATKTVHVTSPTTALSCGSYANTATVTSTYSPTVTADATIQVNCPSLVMTKVAQPATINAGETANFVITIQNIGAGTAYNLVLKDTVPANYDTVTSIPAWDSVTYTPNLDGTTLFQANYNSLAAGDTITVTIQMKSVTTVCGEIYNAAQLTASNSTGTAVSDASITVKCPDLTVSKTAASGIVSAGDPISFNITVTNTGAGTAKNVTLSDTLPTGAGLAWSVGGTDGADCSITSGVVTCNFGDLAPSAVKTITLTSPTTKDSCGTYNNTATVASTNEYTALDNNSSTASITVLCAAISIVKTPVPASGVVNAGDPIAFNITVSNTGAGTAKDIVISDVLPDKPGLSWTISSITPVNVSGSCQLNLIPPQSLTCSFDQLAAGQSVTVQVSSPTTLATACATLDNTASVTTSNDGSAQASASVSVTCANISITKEPLNGSTISAGDQITYSIIVKNNGLSAASNVAITDTLPTNPGLHWTLNTYGYPVGNPGTCAVSTGSPQVLTCTFDRLDPGKMIEVHVVSPTTYATCGTVSNIAAVTTSNDGSATTPPSVVTVNCPAVEVVKTSDTQTVSAGEPITFTITVTNTGEGVAHLIRILDQLPLGITWSINNEHCFVDANDQLYCGLGDLNPGASISVTVTGDTIPAMCGTFDNTATVKMDNGPDVDSNTVSVTVKCPDITVTKEAVSRAISAGDTAAFKIVVSNVGTGTAYGVTLTDTLPAGIAWTIDPAVAECSITGGVLSCSWPSLAADASVTINVSGATDAADCGSLDNTVTVAANNEAAGQTNNQASATIIVNCSDVAVTKEAITGTINAGDTAAFKIVVSNTGAGTAYNVTLTDSLPLGITWTIDPDVTGCAISGNTLSCSFATLAAGAKVEINVSGATSAAICGTLHNTASVSASNETNTTNNSASADITVNCSDVKVTKEAVSGTISAGDLAAFKIVVSNVGAGTAYNVTLTDTLPLGIAWSIDPAVTGCAITGNTLSCSFATLAAGASVTINVSGATSAAVCGKLDNTAMVATSNETNTDNNSASASITVNCSDVAVTKEAVTGTINAGDTAAFKIVVSNIGVGTAYNVTVIDTLPAGLTWTIDPAVTGCAITGNTLSCSFATLAADASVEINVSAQTSTALCGTLDNTVTVAASNEANTANNSASASIKVACSDVTITKTGNGPLSAGDTAVFTLTVTNLGPDAATNVLVTDVLPAGVAWSVDNPACTVSGTSLSCFFASLAPNTPIVLTVSGTTTANSCGSLINGAAVSATNEDATKRNNNTASATIAVNCPDVKVTKTAANAAIHFGQDAVFDIVVENIGVGKAYNVTLTDTLPGTVTWSLVQPVPGCTLTGNTLSCAWSSLDPAAQITIQVKAAISTTAQCADLTNTVTVATTNEKAADTTNNTSTAKITVTCPSDLTVSKTANPAFKRTFAWSISKSVDKTLINQTSGSALFNYTVTVAETGFTDSDWVVTGKITIANPNDWVDIPLTGLTDAVNNGGTCTITNFIAGTNVPKNGSITYDYTCTFSAKPDPYAGVNTATATWDASIGTPHGTASSTANFTFDTGAAGNTTNINKTITVTDTFNGATTTLGTLNATTTTPYTTKTFTYSRSIAVTWSPCKSYTNTAKIVETGQTASQTVTVCGPVKTGALTIGYWQNKNGQAIIKNAGMINGVCKLTPWLRQFAPFQDLSASASCNTVAAYVYNVIKVASAKGSSMNAMLKAQMLATSLDVYFSDPALGGNKIGAPAPIGGLVIDLTRVCATSNSGGNSTCSGKTTNASPAFGGATSMKVMDMLTYAASKSNAGGSTWYGNVKSTQELAKDAFDAINNQWAFAP